MTLPFDIITFDCYGTLIDWRGGIADAFAEAALVAHRTVDRGEILRLHAAIETEVQREGYRLYRDVLTEVAVRIARRIGWDLSKSNARFLAESVQDWRPFPDTNEALHTLKMDGYRLGILSNVDNDLLARTRRHFDIEFDLLVTAEDVHAYKPAPAHFAAARQLIGGNRWLHAAQSWFHDIEPAAALNVTTVWINRLHEEPGCAGTTGIVPDLSGLVDWLSAAPPRVPRPGQESRESVH